MNYLKRAAVLAALLASVSLASGAYAEILGAPADPAAAGPATLNETEQAGLDVMSKLGWGTNADTKALDEDLWHIINKANFGVVWSRPGLSLRDREVVSLTVLITIGSTGVTHIFEHAHDVGITDAELKEIILQTIPYAGQPHAIQAMAELKKWQASKTPKP